jgi:aminoacrylate peracid reductase
MPFETIIPPHAPPPLAPYAPATRAGNTVYVSGMLSVGLDGSTIGVGDVRAQTRYIIGQIADVLAAAGGGLSDIAFNHIFLKRLDDYESFNDVYKEYFGSHPPARYCIRADLVKEEFLVEITAVAHLG